MPIITRDDLITALGGPRATAQLLPNEATGEIDEVKLQSALDDAIGDCQASLGSRWEAMDEVPSLQMKRIAKSLAIRYAWDKNPAKVCPESVRQAFGVAKQDLRDIAEAKMKPGPDAKHALPYGVDNTDGGRRATWPVMRRAGILGSR